MTEYKVIAQNFSDDSENRIHSDEIAKKFGFRGALVPGVAVYGHLTHPLVEALGTNWLAQCQASLKLLKPTYDGEEVTVRCEQDQHGYHVSSYDPHGTLTAVLTSELTKPTLPFATTLLDQSYKAPNRIEIAWDTVEPGLAFVPWTFEITADENQRYRNEVSDRLSLYDDGAVHPHLLLSLANTALTNEYAMPTWIHVGSDIQHHHALTQGDTITIKTAILEKWQKKGHEFIKVWVTFWRDQQITTDIVHTAIYKVAA